MNKTVYLDNGATTQLHPKVLEKMLPYLRDHFGNPSSVHSFGRKTRVAVEEARETIAGLIGADAGEIYFTSSATEANNFAISGIARTERRESGKDRLISYNAEHKSVLAPLEILAQEGFDVAFLGCDRDAALSPDEIEAVAPTGRESLVSIMAVNNETGVINDITSITRSAHEKGAYFHSDAVQAFGKIPIDVKESGIDCMSFTSHKIHGPKGVAALYARRGLPLSPLIHGGGQERNRRGGTESTAAIIGFAEAARIAAENIDVNFRHAEELKGCFVEGISCIDSEGILINGGSNSLPYIASVTFSSNYYRTDAEAMLMYLDINGIAASAGAACSSGTLKPSHAILSCGKSKEDALGTLRFSFSSFNTSGEIERALEVISAMARKFRK